MAHRRTEHYIILYYIALNPFFLFTSYCNFAVRVCVPGTSTVCVLAAEAEDITKMSSSHVRSDHRQSQGRSLRSASSTPPLRDEHRDERSQIRDYSDMFETDLHHGRQDTHAVLPEPQPHAHPWN